LSSNRIIDDYLSAIFSNIAGVIGKFIIDSGINLLS
jgi:hypothetical protein